MYKKKLVVTLPKKSFLPHPNFINIFFDLLNFGVGRRKKPPFDFMLFVMRRMIYYYYPPVKQIAQTISLSWWRKNPYKSRYIQKSNTTYRWRKKVRFPLYDFKRPRWLLVLFYKVHEKQNTNYNIFQQPSSHSRKEKKLF